MGILNLLGDSFIMYNITLAREIGIDEAIIIGEFARKYKYWAEIQGRLTDGYFYISHKDIERDTALSKYRQTEAIKKLVKLGILQVMQLGGMNRANYYKINEVELEKYFCDGKKIEQCIENNATETTEIDNAMLKNLTIDGKKTLPSKVKEFDTTNTTLLIQQTKTTNNKQTEVPSVCIDEVVDDPIGVYVEEKNNTSIKAPRELSWPEFNEAVQYIIPDYSTTHDFYNYCVLNNLHKIDTSMPDWRSIYTGWQAARQC